MPILFTLNRLRLNLNGTGLRRSGVPPSMRGLRPLPFGQLQIVGVTKDSAGAVLGSCDVKLFETATNLPQEQKTSDANGNYAFATPRRGLAYYVVAYKAGAPDVSGTTVNTLVGV